MPCGELECRCAGAALSIGLNLYCLAIFVVLVEGQQGGLDNIVGSPLHSLEAGRPFRLRTDLTDSSLTNLLVSIMVNNFLFFSGSNQFLLYPISIETMLKVPDFGLLLHPPPVSSSGSLLPLCALW
jgi:hypothetical protein